jgi:site-specific DNA-methyltransferase (adenine-specific)
MRILEGDNFTFLQRFKSDRFRLCYTDVPFNTGKTQKLGSMSYPDSFANLQDFLRPRIEEVRRVLTPDGSLFLHVDWRESHRTKIMLDSIFGEDSFINEIIWVYDFGGRSKSRYSSKHDTIFWYAKDPNNYIFRFDKIDRIPYMAPGLCGPEKAAIGKTVTDCWWQTIVPTAGKERTGYPTQKPLAIAKRLVKMHSHKGDKVLDIFAGSGTLGEAALMGGRIPTLIDQNPQAIKVMQERLARFTE